MRQPYAETYRGRPGSNAIEILGGSLACLLAADGRPREAIINAINIGRDTGCRAYVAASIAGAMHGIQALPPDWVELVEKGALTDTYSFDKRTARELAPGFYKAAVNEHARAQTADVEVDSLLAKSGPEIVLTSRSTFVNIRHVETSLARTLTAVADSYFRCPAVAVGM